MPILLLIIGYGKMMSRNTNNKHSQKHDLSQSLDDTFGTLLYESAHQCYDMMEVQV